jgi:hypothetical protein
LLITNGSFVDEKLCRKTKELCEMERKVIEKEKKVLIGGVKV